MNRDISYYEYIMGESEDSIKYVFHDKWIKFLDSLDVPYKGALQLRIGSHLRPLLVYWGYFLGKKGGNPLELDQVTEIALCVEILHKVSIIVDDLIDKDVSRHNASTFHIQYTPEETIIFAVYMIGIAFEKLNSTVAKMPDIHNNFIKIYSQTLHIMAKGCLQELMLDSNSKYDLHGISEIISMETSTLIRNSISLGYFATMPKDNDAIHLVNAIGEKVGYLFQVLNDMEPFASESNIIIHKGSLNIDFNRSRKNIVLPYIYGCCSVREKKKLMTPAGENTNYILELYSKYQVEQLIQNDLCNIEMQIEKCFCDLQHQSVNINCLTDFISFYKKIVEIGKARLIYAGKEPID